MARKQTHRGLHPKDADLFSEKIQARLRQAAGDLCWLLSRGYAPRSATELVGNRYTLTARQRMAIQRSACSEQARDKRRRQEIDPTALRGHELWIDGYNVLTVLESALAGGVVLFGMDHCCRDVAGIHRRYRKMAETIPALRMVGDLAQQWEVSVCRWYLDKPVANSGRLKSIMLATSAEAGWEWTVDLVYNPDRLLAESGEVVATSDSAILDRCHRWINLTWRILSQAVPGMRLVDLSGATDLGQGLGLRGL